MDEKCCICGGPYIKEFIDEHGEKRTERITCLDHQGILPYLWNRHSEYLRFHNLDRYRRSINNIKDNG